MADQNNCIVRTCSNVYITVTLLFTQDGYLQMIFGLRLL